jgi:Tol biopolymer transport system component
VHPDGTGIRQLTHFDTTTRLLQNGSFSPDGKLIVFATTDGAKRTARAELPDVLTMRVDGTHITPVTRERNWDGSPDWGP